MPKKCILVILDGLGDRAHRCLNNRTPLQAARTPVLDHLAAGGSNGLYHAACVGQALPSENAHFTLFGYDHDEFPGRGALEALGAGIMLQPDDVAILAHIASVREDAGRFILVKEDFFIDPEDAGQLIDCIESYHDRGTSVRFHRTRGVFGILTMHGHVSPHITDTDLMLEGLPIPVVRPWKAHSDDPAAHATARTLSRYLSWVYERLMEHPVNAARVKDGKAPLNFIVTQRAGQIKNVEPFTERYGLRGVTISSGLIYHGLCTYIGFDAQAARDSGDAAADIEARLLMARDLLAKYDFIHVHTKAPDEAAHRKDPLLKKRVIEQLDSGIGKAIKTLLQDPELLLVISSDHSTPSAGPLIHSGEPVPVTMLGPGIRRDSVQRFDEIHAARGALGFLRGKELLYMILNYLDRSKLVGIMDTRIDQPYFPGHYEPFKVK